jgi:hypothetical protein
LDFGLKHRPANGFPNQLSDGHSCQRLLSGR